ncbi:MAG: hypothetical protein IKG69_06950 [Atopobiaceae bacterium]|nr:hypothetical protein [Atopobiaceae bacterium]
MPKVVTGAPAWACEFLRRMGYSPRNVMDPYVASWWRWYAACDEFYRPERTAAEGVSPRACEHLTLFPARMAAEEWAALVMDEKTVIASTDAEVNGWVAERFDGFVATGSDELALAFALGFGVWAANFSGIVGEDAGGATAVVDYYDAGQVVPLLEDAGESVSVALVSRVLVGGRAYDRVQVHEPDPDTGGTYHLRTWLFEPERHAKPVALDEVVADLDTGSVLPTYCMVAPAIANTYEEATPCGVSVFADAVDAIRLLDETFDGTYWRTRLCQPRMVVDEQGLAIDKQTGKVKMRETIDQRLFKGLQGGVGQQLPVTVFAPDMQAEDMERAMNNALSVFSAKCGLGPNYWSFTRQGVNKTAREVVSDNSQLMRNCRRHERAVGAQIRRLVAGTWCAEVALRTGAMPEPPEVTVEWDDSVVEDTEAERAMMKDDIARGLCPAHLYPMRFYGMDEAEARALVAQASAPAFPEEL